MADKEQPIEDTPSVNIDYPGTVLDVDYDIHADKAHLIEFPGQDIPNYPDGEEIQHRDQHGEGIAAEDFPGSAAPTTPEAEAAAKAQVLGGSK